MANEMSVDEMKENVTNILAGVKAQNGFRKTFTEAAVRAAVTDTAAADALVAKLNEGYDAADAKFDTAAQAEAGEIDAQVADDENLVADLYKV